MTEPRAITRALLAWFRANRRDLPWRRTQNPYFIWLSEVMLQQTQVATVIPYYERFVAQFPTPAALASAPTDAVLKAWEGLGYYSRARNLQAAAKEVVARHGGAMPDTFEALRALPGLGDYTAGAVASIAFDRRVSAVDGNVLRVIARLALVRDDVTLPATRKAIAAIAETLLPDEKPGELNEALMELGATVCTPKSPRCGACPVAGHCRALAAGLVAELPVKAKKKKPTAVTLAVGLVERDGRILLVKRPEGGIWGGLWGLPAVEVSGDGAREALTGYLAAEGLTAEVGAVVATLAHTLTHRQLSLPIFSASASAGAWRGEHAWVERGALGDYALPVPFRKAVSLGDFGPLFR